MKISVNLFVIVLISLLSQVSVSAEPATIDYSQRADVKQFIDMMVSKYHFDGKKLTQEFASAKRLDNVLEAISKPAEKVLTWKQYRPIFITASRIREGVHFMKKNRDELKRAEKIYGVPAQVIAAIVGVETYYGKRSGGISVFDSLTTLAFDYPQRGPFFRGELAQFLLLTREEHIDVNKVYGSYAGAMGMPQFISSSYRTYAVDFDGDGKRDLWNDRADVIGSVANYFNVHGWVRNQPVAFQVKVDKKIPDDPEPGDADARLKPYTTVDKLRAEGVQIDSKIPGDTKVTLLSFDGEKGKEYWIGLENFYVITRYNHSALYAMAVHQLSQKLLALTGDPS